jgi:cell division septal protein FtsQ
MGVVRATVLTSALLVGLTAFVFSPLVRVQTVVWTGRVTLPEARYLAFEAATLGHSLWLLPEKSLKELLAADSSVFALEFRRHPPHTLEVCIQPRDAVARLANGTVVDPQGRILGGHPVEDLPLLLGVAIDAEHERVDHSAQLLLAALHEHLPTAAVRLQEIERQGDEWNLILADTGTRVRVGSRNLIEQIQKLRVYEQSLAQGEMPAAIDLRWKHQIILGNQPGRAGGAHG